MIRLADFLCFTCEHKRNFTGKILDKGIDKTILINRYEMLRKIENISRESTNIKTQDKNMAQ